MFVDMSSPCLQSFNLKHSRLTNSKATQTTLFLTVVARTVRHTRVRAACYFETFKLYANLFPQKNFYTSPPLIYLIYFIFQYTKDGLKKIPNKRQICHRIKKKRKTKPKWRQ